MVETERLVPNLFIVAAVIAVLSCLARPDFNLPLFAFGWFVWADPDKVSARQRERLKLLGLLIITFVVDFIWLCYWGPIWNSDTEYGRWEKGVHSFVLSMSSINFVIKVPATQFVIIIFVVMAEKSSLSDTLPASISSRLSI